MAKKLLVKTPQTTDGITPMFDEEKRLIYKETFLPTTARVQLEGINATLPEILRHEFSEVETEINEAGREYVVKPKAKPTKDEVK